MSNRSVLVTLLITILIAGGCGRPTCSQACLDALRGAIAKGGVYTLPADAAGFCAAVKDDPLCRDALKSR